MKSSFGDFCKLTVIFTVLLGSLLLSQNALGVPPTAPPLNLRFGSPPATTSITLAWDPPSGVTSPSITGYQIERAGQTTPPTFDAYSTLVPTTGTTSTSYTDSGLLAGKLFKYKVSAINSDGIGPVSNELTAATQSVAGQFADNLQFTGTQIFQPGQIFGTGTQFAANQQFTGVQTFGSGSIFGAGTQFVANQLFTSTQTFTGSNTFGANAKFSIGQTFPAALQSFGNFVQFGKNTDFTAFEQTFTAGIKFGSGTDFIAGQDLPANVVLGQGLLLAAIVCATTECTPSGSALLSPGEFLSPGTNPAAIANAISASDKSFSVEGLGVDMVFATVSTAGNINVDLMDPASVSGATSLGGGKLSMSASGLTFTTTSSVMEIAADTAVTSGSITITIPYDEANIPAGVTESQLKLLHFTGGVWITESTSCSVDTVNNKITCTVTSLSPFATGANAAASSSSSSSGGGGHEQRSMYDPDGFGSGKSLAVHEISFDKKQNRLSVIVSSTAGPITVQVSHDGQRKIAQMDSNQPLAEQKKTIFSISLPDTKLANVMVKDKRDFFTYKVYLEKDSLKTFTNSGYDKYIEKLNQKKNKSTNSDENADLSTAQSTQPLQTGITETVRKWSGYVPESISDSQMLHSIEIDAESTPSWVKKIAKFVVSGDITEQDFVNAIKYMYGKGIIK